MRSLHRSAERPSHALLASCQSSAVKQREITTLEGLGTPEKPTPFNSPLSMPVRRNADSCLSGVILTAKALLDQQPNASGEDLREALGGVLCRCFTHNPHDSR